MPAPRVFLVPPVVSAPFVLEAQRELPPNERVTFQLRTLTPPEWARAADAAGFDRDLWQGTYGLVLLAGGLRGWSGPGVPPWKCDAAGAPTEETLGALSPSVRGELARAVYRLSATGSPDAPPHDGPPPPPRRPPPPPPPPPPHKKKRRG